MLKDILSNFVKFYSIPLSSHIVLLFLLSQSQISLRPRCGDGFCNCDCEWVQRSWHFFFLNTLSVTFFIASFSFPLHQNQKQSQYIFFFFWVPSLIFRIESITLISSVFHVLLLFLILFVTVNCFVITSCCHREREGDLR